jgi:hypothetical protein
MVWKMSTDLSRPLVPSMGHHDALDGFITCIQLQTTNSALSSTPNGPSLTEEAADFATMMEGQDWATVDPLGLGGLLVDASRVAQLMQFGAPLRKELLETLLVAALQGLAHFVRRNDLGQPASQRLAFRELGLAIGLSAIELIEKENESAQRLRTYAALGSAIESFWLDPEHRKACTWLEHRDINEVMLATSLSPAGFLVMPPAKRS